jgi:chromosomal replication initiation ATPase DnaA
MRIETFVPDTPEFSIIREALRRVEFHREGKRLIAYCNTAAEAAFTEMVAAPVIKSCAKTVFKEDFLFEIIQTNGADGIIASEEHNRLLGEGHLNPSYTFDTFVAGEANREALNAAIRVCGMVGYGERAKVLYIYGSTGLGKTHLLQATIDGLLLKGKQVVYFNGNDFVSYLVSALKQEGGSYQEHMQIFNKADVLAVDDITYLKTIGEGGKKGMVSSAKEFKGILDRYLDAGKWCLFTGECYPDSEHWDIPEPISGRLQMGFVSEVQKPDLELRKMLIKHSFESAGGMPIDQDIVDFIADADFPHIRALLQFCQRLRDRMLPEEETPTFEEATKLMGSLHITNSSMTDSIVAKEMASLEISGVPLVELQGKGLSWETREIRNQVIRTLAAKTKIRKTSLAQAFHISPQYVSKILSKKG